MDEILSAAAIPGCIIGPIRGNASLLPDQSATQAMCLANLCDIIRGESVLSRPGEYSERYFYRLQDQSAKLLMKTRQ